MTRERIKDFKEIILPFFTIYFLKENYEGLGKSDAEEFEKDFNEILNLAAKALEQQPCEDTISRQDALDALHMCLSTNSYDDDVTGDSYICYEEAEYEIEKLPPVQPKPKVGQWVLLDECSNSGYYCSECHKKLVKEGWSGTVKKIKFCPNCGSKMIEPQESEDKE